MVLQWHPFVFGLILVVAVGTAAFTLWGDRRRHQPYDNNYHRQNEFTFKYDIPTHEEKERKKRPKLNDSCSICLGQLKGGVRNLTCGHVFHVNCIDKWIIENNTCPNCRKKVA